jgi:arabinogalactan endo-1,4-beta-galactosidase
MKIVNTTPFTVIVFSGYCHWDKPIEELEESFATLAEAKYYAKSIKEYRPEYRVIIEEE